MIKIKKTSDQSFSFVNFLVFGESGAGKTTFLGSGNEAETLILNIVSESGLLTLRKKNIDVIDILTKEDMFEALDWIEKEGVNKYKVICIDSFSQFQKNLEKSIPGGTGGAVFEKWNKIKEITRNVVDRLKSMPVHFVAICEIAMKDDDGAIKFIPSLVGSSKDEISYWFDEVYFFEKTGKAGEMPKFRALTQSGSRYPCKSRIGTLPVVIENPTLPVVLDNLMQSATPQAKEQRESLELLALEKLISEKNIPCETIYSEYKVKDLKELNLEQRLDLEKRLKLKK